MSHDRIRQAIAQAEQATAVAEGLVPPGGTYQLTPDQEAAVEALCQAFEAGERAALLEAPTGSGKTAVAFRVLIERKLANPSKPVAVLAPTRDLARQWVRYLEARLAGSPLKLAQLHGGVPPQERERILDAMELGTIAILVASGLPLHEEEQRAALRKCSLLVADDLHAFDPRVHLRRLDGLNVPTLALSATPEPVEAFLAILGADRQVVRMQAKPFEAPPTQVHLRRAHLKMPLDKQVALASTEIEAHLALGGRIYVVSRTRNEVPRLAAFLSRVTGAQVFSIHGEMADSLHHARRTGQGKGLRHGGALRTRIEMLEAFRNTSPSILVGTNLIAAGLDVPAADLMVLTDADGFGPAEREQLIGRVGRRERASEAVLIVGTLVSIKGSRSKPRPSGRPNRHTQPKAPKAKATPQASEAKGLGPGPSPGPQAPGPRGPQDRRPKGNPGGRP